MPPLPAAPDSPDIDNPHLTVDEMEALGIIFEDYEKSDDVEGSAVELNEGTWEALHRNINPRRWDLKTYFLANNEEYEVGYYDDPPKPYPKPYKYNDDWRVSFPIDA